MERSLSWNGAALLAVDQRRLPDELVVVPLGTVDEVIESIRTLAVRGAPAIGLAGAFAVAMAARRHPGDERAVRAEAQRVVATRPTAINLVWAVRRALSQLAAGPDAVLDEALTMLAEDEQVNHAVAGRAADAVRRLVRRRPMHVLTHCNTGRLATTAWGTALGAIRQLAAEGLVESVLAGETRPLLQGARLTAWELAEAGIPYRLCVDSAGPAAIAAGMVDCVLVGADRITRNGDVANKVGTYMLAIAAARSGVPFIVVAAESTVDESTPYANSIVIEQRAGDEVTSFGGVRVAPAGAEVYNPAFDVTPADLVTAIVTERRTFAAAGGVALAATARQLYARGWMNGTAGNLSIRVPGHPDEVLITGSGLSKSQLTASDLVRVVASTGESLEPAEANGLRPSAETSIHASVYRTLPGCGAVVHAHPPHATAVATMVARTERDTAQFTDFEIIKGFGMSGAGVVEVPVLPNHVDVPRIAAELAGRLSPHAPPVMLIADHGATTWGSDLETAKNRMECLETLCQLHLLTRGEFR